MWLDTYEPHYPLAWAKMMAYDLNGNYRSEISNSKTFNTLTPEIYRFTDSTISRRTSIYC